MGKLIIIASVLAAFNGLAQSIPPSNLFNTGQAGQMPRPQIPPLNQAFIPQSNGDHSTNPDLFRRQLQSIRQDAQNLGQTWAQLAIRLSTFMGTTVIRPPANSPGSQFFPMAFEIVPPVHGTLADGRTVTWRWWRAVYGQDQTNVASGGTYFQGTQNGSRPANLFAPPSSTPNNPTGQPNQSSQRVEVRLFINPSGGGVNGVVIRMVGGFSGNTNPNLSQRSREASNTIRNLNWLTSGIISRSSAKFRRITLRGGRF